MSINDYIAGLESVINSSTIVSSYNLNIDRKTSPHHKHLKNGTIVESQQVKLSDIISEIEGLYIADVDK